MIYLDHAAHTPADSAVIEEFCRVERQFLANPIAAHSAGQAARSELDRITSAAAGLLGANPQELIHTSGATEANNLAVKGITRAYRHVGKHIITTCLEHSSISGPLAVLKEQGWEVELADILPDGTVDLEHIAALLRRDTVLLSIPWVDSELGAIQPIRAIGKILENYPHCRFHVDASQAVGKIPVKFEKIDTLSFSPHKFHGLCGCGVLLKRDSVRIEPLIHGGLSNTMFRSGTPALALAASSYKALALAINEQASRLEKVKILRKHVIKAFEKSSLIRINSPKANGIYSPYILNLSVQGIKGIDFQTALDRRGVCVSVKSACSAPGTPSRPVLAISRDKKNAMCSWRIGFSHCNGLEEIETFLKIFDDCCNDMAK